MFVPERVYIHEGFCVCLYSRSMFMHVFVCPVILGHSHRGCLFLVLKDFVCMRMSVSMGICTHHAYVCACCVCVCVFFGSGLVSGVRRLW